MGVGKFSTPQKEIIKIWPLEITYIYAYLQTTVLQISSELEKMATPTVDDYMNNEKWMTRVKASFDIIDLNKNGTVEMDDWKRWVENIKNATNPDAALLEKLTKVLTDYCAGMGVTAGTKLSKDQYVKAIAEFVVAENAKRAKGETTLRDKVNYAFYDVVDKNHDGYVTKEEFCAIMAACNVKPELAEQRFNEIDTNKNGKIERKELCELHDKLWSEL